MTDPVEKNLSLPLEIEDRNWSSFFKHISVGVLVFVAILFCIAAWAPVHEVAMAQGQITPQGSVTKVEHLEGGIVDQVLVKVGQKITKNEVLVRLKPVAATSDYEQLVARKRSLELTKIRLEALLDGLRPNYSEFKTSHAELVRQNEDFYNEALEKAEHQDKILRSRISQRQGQIKALAFEIKNLRTQVAIQQEQFNIKHKLIKSGYTTRVSYLEAKSRLQDSLSKLESAKSQHTTALDGLEEAKAQLASAISNDRELWSKELSGTLAGLDEVGASLGRLTDRVERLEVRAPMSGTVQSLSVQGASEVVNPGDLVVEIVPGDPELIAEVRLMPDDINDVAVGSEAKVHLTAFDPKEFLPVDAKVIAVSPGTSRDEQGNYYYLARLSLSKQKLRREGRSYDVRAGMVVRAEIIKDERTVLRYMLKPVFRALDTSFGEH